MELDKQEIYGVNMGNTLSVENLKKTFRCGKPLLKTLVNPFQKARQVCAIDSLSFSIKPNEILGVVGPNGAGKTTLLKILAGLLWQDEGKVEILGLNYRSADKVLRKHIGYVSSDERSFFWRLSGRDNLEFFGRLYGMRSDIISLRIEELLHTFNSDKYANRIFGDYSAGMRKRIAVIRALLHKPSILLLDEVTNSLDPDSSEQVKDGIRSYISQEANRAAIWSTHRLEEISSMCDNVISMNSGKIISNDKVDNCSNKKQSFMLKTKPLHKDLEAFCTTFKGHLQTTNKYENLNEFIFKNLEEEDFSKIVTVAVKDYGAYVLFAGYLEKSGQV